MGIVDLIRERGPVTVAAFMELALYDPAFGYYARAAQRSGRAGDFFTSVDVGPLFGDLLAEQIAEMAHVVSSQRSAVGSQQSAVGSQQSAVGSQQSAVGSQQSAVGSRHFDVVEAGAGNGRLSADILRALKAHHPDVYARTALHLVERSASARDAQRGTLGDVADRMASSSPDLPDSFQGVLIANELLDAMPVHQVVMRDAGLKEVYVAAAGGGLATVEGPVSTPEIERYLADAGVTLEPGWRVEINLAAAAWVRDAATRLRRGFILLFDYGHDARELYSVTHSGGTLTSFTRHVAAGAEASPVAPPWLRRPGDQDITAHVDFSTVQRVAREQGMHTAAFLDQTYFVMGILQTRMASQGSTGGSSPASIASTRALRTLMMPGGLGSTMKTLILSKDVGEPALMGCSFRVRVT